MTREADQERRAARKAADATRRQQQHKDRCAATNCPVCAEAGQQGSCARLRCYCGHKECWAFDSYYKPESAAVATVRAPDERMAKSWAERDEPTWLDR